MYIDPDFNTWTTEWISYLNKMNFETIKTRNILSRVPKNLEYYRKTELDPRLSDLERLRKLPINVAMWGIANNLYHVKQLGSTGRSELKRVLLAHDIPPGRHRGGSPIGDGTIEQRLQALEDAFEELRDQLYPLLELLKKPGK